MVSILKGSIRFMDVMGIFFEEDIHQSKGVKSKGVKSAFDSFSHNCSPPYRRLRNFSRAKAQSRKGSPPYLQATLYKGRGRITLFLSYK